MEVILSISLSATQNIEGKPSLENLPATYVENNQEATTLLITLFDEVIQTKIILSYTIYEDLAVITRNAYCQNCGSQNLILNQMMSMSLDLPDKDYEMIELTGAWFTLGERPSYSKSKIRTWDSVIYLFIKRLFKQ